MASTIQTTLLDYSVTPNAVYNFTALGNFNNNLNEYNTIELMYNNLSKENGNYYYTKFPINVLNYNQIKIDDNNSNIAFTEFTDEKTENKIEYDNLLTEYNKIKNENAELNNSLNSIINKYNNDDSQQMANAMREEIISLRIQLGQGKTSSDFSTVFPYLPN